MILVTVGTHQQPFDRLIAAAEAYAAATGEEVVLQRGPSRVPSPHCESHALLPPETLDRLMRRARLVITHGGPASILGAQAAGHVPIVVPRRAAHREHVDDHQVDFTGRLRDRVHVLDDPADLPEAIASHDAIVQALSPSGPAPERTARFAADFGRIVDELVARSRKRSLRARLAHLRGRTSPGR